MGYLSWENALCDSASLRRCVGGSEGVEAVKAVAQSIAGQIAHAYRC